MKTIRLRCKGGEKRGKLIVCFYHNVAFCVPCSDTKAVGNLGRHGGTEEIGGNVPACIIAAAIFRSLALYRDYAIEIGAEESGLPLADDLPNNKEGFALVGDHNVIAIACSKVLLVDVDRDNDEHDGKDADNTLIMGYKAGHNSDDGGNDQGNDENVPCAVVGGLGECPRAEV